LLYEGTVLKATGAGAGNHVLSWTPAGATADIRVVARSQSGQAGLNSTFTTILLNN
jgi:hypothetical protein